MTRKDVEEIKGHFDGVATGLREELKQHVANQVGGMREEMGGLRTELRAEFRSEMGGLREEMRAEFRSEMGGLREEMRGFRDELRAETAEVRRHAGALADDLRSEIRMVADGVALANERIDHLDLRVDSLTGEVRRGFAGVRAEVHRLHETDDELRRRIEAQEQRGA